MKKRFAWCALIALVLGILSSCRAVNEVEKVYVHDTTIVVERDTTREIEIQHDSVDRWHTHYEFVKGDTIYKVDSVLVDRWHTKIDTSQHTKIEYVDRIKVEYRDKEVVKEKKVYVWYPCVIVIALILATFIWYIVRGVKKNLIQ